jgi:hypothetical protein
MHLEISPKTEARLVSKAQEQGLSVDAFLERLLNETGDQPANTANSRDPVLPAQHLGVRSSLHRRDIYDDVD